jgi:hypothetical protein
MIVKDAGKTPLSKDVEKRPFPVRKEVEVQKFRCDPPKPRTSLENGGRGKRK